MGYFKRLGDEMEKFTFLLDNVLDFKNQSLESLKEEHAKMLQKVNEQKEKIQRLYNRYCEYNNNFNKKKNCGVSIIEATGYERFLRNMEYEIESEYAVLENLKILEDEKRNQVIDMKKETSSIKKLKEKKLEQYNKELQKTEELFIEEFVSHQRASN